MRNSSRFLIFTLILTLCFAFGCGQKKEQAEMEEETAPDLQLSNVPQAVMDGLKAKFPQAEIQKWTREMEGEMTVYDIEFMQGDQKFEADIMDNGMIHNWEKAIEAAALPEPVKMAFEAKYPGVAMKEIMEITKVTDGQEALEGYEIVCESSEMEMMEVMVSPAGEIMEHSHDEMMEEMPGEM